MQKKGIAQEFAERVFEQIRGFGEYGFPESHAASFALIAYATAWMKCHYHDAFTCSLLNAQPMGFYAPSTIIEDAKRHDVEIRPIDVQISNWHCTLEPTGDKRRFAVRLGLRYVKGLSTPQGERIEQARAAAPFASVDDFIERTRLDEGTLARLAEAGALAGFDGRRRAALWQVRGTRRVEKTPLELAFEESTPEFADLEAFETILWDYRTTGNSPRGHPLAPLREELTARKLPDARTVTTGRDGRQVRYAGIVICRQRPGTASGVVFMTLEDETGFVNVVVWSQVFEEYAALIKTSSFLGVSGKLQVTDGVVHLIADKFWRPKVSTSPAPIDSHDFH